MFRILIFLCLLPLEALYAQEDKAASIPRLTLKTNVTTLLNPSKTAAMLTADLRLAPRLSADVGGGAFLFSSFFADSPGEYYRGLRSRAGMKYFFTLKPELSWHLGWEAKYNYINHLYWDRVFRQGQQFEEILQVKRTVESQGLALRTGVQMYLAPDKRLLLDIYTGFGFMINRVTESNRPPDAENVFERGLLFSRDDFRYPTGNRTIADYLLGLHIGYSFW